MAPPTRRPLRIAHRGMPCLARENTLASFSLALDAGADGIELDVHATRDGVVVVHHDHALANGTAISELSFVQLGHATAESGQIPTLAAVCDLVSGRAELFVEIKGDGIEERVADVLAGCVGPVAIHSFDHPLIRRLSLGGSAFRLGLLIEESVTHPARLLERHGALDLWPRHPLVSRAMVEEVHAAGGRVIPWTVNAAADVERVTALGVDGICTDDVRRLERR